LVTKDCDTDPLNITWRKFCYDDDKVKDKAAEDGDQFHNNSEKVIQHQVYFRQDYTTPNFIELKQDISQDLYNSTISKHAIAEGPDTSTPMVRNIVFQTNLETTTLARPATISSMSTAESSRNPIIITTQTHENNLVDETKKVLEPTERTTIDTPSDHANLLRLCFLDATFCTPRIVQNPQGRTTTITTQTTTTTLQTTSNIFSPPTTTSEGLSKLAELLQRCFLDTKYCQFDSSDNQIVEPVEQSTTTGRTSTSTNASTRNPLEDSVRRCLFQGICNN